MAKAAAKTEADPGVASVNRALSILMAFEDSVEGMTLTDLMNATGLYHSTILRICESLEHFGFIKRLDDNRYMLGPTPFYLGMLYQESFRLWDYAAPVLRELVRQTKETAAIYIREGDERICLHRMTQPRSVLMHVREGDRVELKKGAAGKVLLAFGGESGAVYDRVRKAGYAVSLAERETESAAIACPVFATRQRLVCAISLGMPLFRFDKAAFDAYLPLVMEAGRQLTTDLGGDPALFAQPYAKLEGVKLPH
jgi:DNA-binding IclR family transcriptional regulator